jgi:hypothetical protein
MLMQYDASRYTFEGGYPDAETIQRAYDDADLSRAVQAYKFFYPSVSFEGTWRGNLAEGAVPNQVFLLLEGTPRQLVFTPNSDTPYSGLPLDLTDGPIVVELPPGPLMGAANDLNQRWVSDLGLPGPDAGKGGKHLFVPPGYAQAIPGGYHVGQSTTNRVLILVRSIPPEGNVDAANAMMQSIKVYPLDSRAGWREPTWVRLTKGDFTPLQWETNIRYWEVLHQII